MKEVNLMKKRILSLVLAVTLIVAMTIPASAYSISMSRTWNNFTYHTNDACYTNRVGCTIESESSQYTVATNADIYVRCGYTANGDIAYCYEDTAWGTAQTFISQSNKTVDYTISYIWCYHKLNGTTASSEKVWAN